MATWQDRATFNVSRLTYLFENETDSDVTLIVGDEPGWRFELHKLVLSMWSAEFWKMFNSPEAQAEIHIPEIQPEIFEIAMKYIYEEKFAVKTLKEALETYLVAERYSFKMLERRCLDYITSNMYPENMPLLYERPELLDRLQLRYKCQAILSEETSAVLRCNRFLDSPILMIEDIIQMPQLDIDSEVELFQFVLHWTKAECARRNIECTAINIRSIMDNFLPYIRFMAMTMQEFYAGTVTTRMLTDTEIAQISENLIAPGSRRLPAWCSHERERNSKRSFHLMDCHVCAFSDVLFPSVDCTIKLLNGSMTLRGISVVVRGFDESTAFTVKWNSQTISICDARPSYDHNTNVLKFTLVDPIPLNLHSEYKISVTSNRDVFPKCYRITISPFIRHHKNFELLCALGDSLPATSGSASLFNGCSHLDQIFYS